MELLRCAGEGMTLLQKIQELYSCEVNWSVETFWDEGYDFVLGDGLNGDEECANFTCFDAGVEWLYSKATEKGLLVNSDD
jgi:hypothetical protein